MFQSRFARMRRRCGGFSLVEVAVALGIFAFAITPVVGLMGLSLNASKDSIDASAMTQIFRLAETRATTSASSTSSLAAMYFSNDGEEDTTSTHANTIYLVNFNPVSRTDAAQGLLARKLWEVTVTRASTPNTILSKRFLQVSSDPADLISYFQ